LNPKEPLPSADKFVEVVYSSHGIPTLIHYAEDYWQWKGNTYHKVETGAVQSRLLHFLEHAKVEYKSKDDDDDWTTLKAFPITPSNLNSIENLLRRRIFQSAGDATPCWIGGKYGCEMPSSVSDPSQLIFGKSTILNLADMGILPPSPFWLNLAALDFDYDPTALCPQWNDFLDSIFEDDEQSKQTLMEWMGLCLTSITKFQKALFLVGKKRSGKGTIAKILQKIVGHHNVTAQSTSDFAQTFGFESFLGKTLAIVSDARIGRQTYTAGFTEKVLNIVGEDTIKINRKHRDALSVRLLTKLMLLSNEVPHIIDQSGALASRFIFLKFPKSFYGNEDTELEGKLLGELPGILCLAILHLQNLLNRGYFIQPGTGKELSQRMTALSSPVGEFAAKLVPYMTQDDIWNKWKACRDIEGLRYGSKNALWNDLESAGYTCDFDMANILVKIRDCYGEAQTRDLRDCSRRFREPGALEEKLDEAIKLGVLRVRIETAGNNKPVQIYSEPVSSANEDDTTRYHDPEPTPSMNGSDAEQNGDVDPDIF
jgi:putative DNA primase/helicase